jgi:hypothetical protein
MKKTLTVLFALSLVPALMSSSCAMDYSESVESGGLTYFTAKRTKKAFASVYAYDGTEAGKQIVVLDNIQGFEVNELGGFMGRGLPCPFYMSIPNNSPAPYTGVEDKECPNAVITEDDPATTPSWYPAGYTIEKIVFEVSIGKNIAGLPNVEKTNYFCFRQQDKSYYIYQTEMTWVCSEDNATFYAKDGILYNRKDNSKAI